MDKYKLMDGEIQWLDVETSSKIAEYRSWQGKDARLDKLVSLVIGVLNKVRKDYDLTEQ